MEEKNGKPSELAEAMMQYLDCECRYFPPMRDDTELCAAYFDALRDATDGGYVPMLIKVDEVLFECLIMNSDPDSDGEDDYRFDAAAVAAYRREQLSRELPDGREILKGYLADRREEAEDDEIDWDREIVGAVEGGEEIDCFSAYRDYRSEETAPVILAKIPVKHAWEIFAYLPFGGWNDCPDTEELMAVTKYWAVRRLAEYYVARRARVFPPGTGAGKQGFGTCNRALRLLPGSRSEQRPARRAGGQP